MGERGLLEDAVHAGEAAAVVWDFLTIHSQFHLQFHSRPMWLQRPELSQPGLVCDPRACRGPSYGHPRLPSQAIETEQLGMEAGAADRGLACWPRTASNVFPISSLSDAGPVRQQWKAEDRVQASHLRKSLDLLEKMHEDKQLFLEKTR